MASRQPRLHITPIAARTYSIFDLSRRLGQEQRTVAWLARYLDKLISQSGFPAPFPVMRGEQLITAVTGNSRWSRPPVDMWFEGFVPPTLAAGIEEEEARAAADVMDARAARLGLRLVGGNAA